MDNKQLMTLETTGPAVAAVGSGALAGEAQASPTVRTRRRRLDHVDAMRPLKQVGVLSTHAVIIFGPGGLTVGACLILLHFARVGFLFVSACMLTYSYYGLKLSDLGFFWRKRLLAVGLPYAAWTVIYFALGLHSFKGSVASGTGDFFRLLLVGYSQLYFLVVLLEFYVLFPLVLWLLRRTERHHGLVLGVSLALQFLYVSLIHWGVTPGFLSGSSATREVFSYQFYLLAGCVGAVHYQQMHDFFVRHVRAIWISFVATGLLAEAWYWLGAEHVIAFIGSSDDAFQPIVIPFNIAAIAFIYVIGVALVRPAASQPTRHFTHTSSDNSYSIYLSQVAFLDLLVTLGWRHLSGTLPWPAVVGGAVVIVFLCGCLLGGLIGRTPLAWPVVGRHQASWSSLAPWFMKKHRPGEPEPQYDALGPGDVVPPAGP